MCMKARKARAEHDLARYVFRAGLLGSSSNSIKARVDQLKLEFLVCVCVCVCVCERERERGPSHM